MSNELATLEINFRTYINEKGLGEESYKVTTAEYSEEIKTLKEKIKNNAELVRIWRIIIANETFCNEYGGVSFTDESVQNLYKEIYDKHLNELK